MIDKQSQISPFNALPASWDVTSKKKEKKKEGKSGRYFYITWGKMSNATQRESFHANKKRECSRSSYIMRWEAAVTESPKIEQWLNTEPHAATVRTEN